MNRKPTGQGREWRGYAHERLDVYRVARGLVTEIYRATESFDESERSGLVAQLRRASVSIPVNIAEGAARGTRREFSRFLQIARGSATELRVLLDAAHEVGALTSAKHDSLGDAVERVFAMTSGLLRSTASRNPRPAE
ncbi:MAG TPA: four helix bundle protein [Thermoanaerobaculia bacterium]|nr:four helix bundle protein [Thermoanaerobaculia bacterium]